MRSSREHSYHSWGRPDLFHADGKVPDHPGEWMEADQQRNRRDSVWLAELLRVDPEARESVVRTFLRTNNLVRMHLRTETGLRLNVGDDVASIPVEVVDGIPHSMGHVLDDFADIAPFLLRQPLLTATVDGVGFLEKNEVAADLVLDRAATKQSERILPFATLHLVRLYAEGLLSELNERNSLRALLAIDHDTMGAYWFRGKRIQLYWMPIAIIAKSLGVSIESLTIIVLAHELAHAYTHRGRDIDGHDWDTDAFAMTDRRIVEGFAQHYARAVCRRLAQREPDLISTFDKLLNQQPEPYTAFLSWINEDSESLRGEIMRSTLIATRHAEIHDYDEFLPLVMQQSSQIKGARRT